MFNFRSLSKNIFNNGLSRSIYRSIPSAFAVRTKGGSRRSLFCISTSYTECRCISCVCGSKVRLFCQPISAGFRAAPQKRLLFDARNQLSPKTLLRVGSNGIASRQNLQWAMYTFSARSHMVYVAGTFHCQHHNLGTYTSSLPAPDFLNSATSFVSFPNCPLKVLIFSSFQQY